ncbi:hypothetical protein J2I47_06295 [Fibrella sp. HMF5335]|uniref:Uncharacterized protein n=1 Tax=Fibrella rubiginis TaxID=2817060 RepID=A0A939GD41_9BACT|nr:hypothetical protein [Fibrella rubiginis]MBO0936151.1 hypothetical protein [Fibrella rubiginis]
MKTSTKHVFFALSLTALLGSCSRPTATFQPSHAQRFYSPQPTATVVTTTNDAVAEAAPAVESTPVATATPAATKADIENVLVKAEAMASTKATATESRKLNRRIAKIREVLAKAPEAAPATNASAKKNTLVQRMMLKRMDTKMKNQLAPEKPMAASTLTAGIVIGLIGLLLLLLTTGTAATLGLIGLIVGIVLIILGLL